MTKLTATRIEDSADRQFVTALARGMQILKCFDASHRELGSMEISKMTGLPQATVWRLCYTFVSLGYLVQSAQTDKFRVGLGIMTIGHAAIWSANRRDLVLQEMQQMADMSGCAVSLAIRDGAEMLIIERCVPPNAMLVVNLRTGSRLPIASTAMGWAYLAGLDISKRRSVLKSLGVVRNPSLKTAIDSAVDEYATSGFTRNAGRYHPEINAIAAPVSVVNSEQLLAINCGGPASVIEMKVLESRVASRLTALARLIGITLSAADFPQLK